MCVCVCVSVLEYSNVSICIYMCVCLLFNESVSRVSNPFPRARDFIIIYINVFIYYTIECAIVTLVRRIIAA